MDLLQRQQDILDLQVLLFKHLFIALLFLKLAIQVHIVQHIFELNKRNILFLLIIKLTKQNLQNQFVLNLNLQKMH